MLEDLQVGIFLFELVEVVHIQLTDERGKVVVLEILWKYVVGEQIGLFNLKSVSCRGPANNFIELSAVDYLIYLHQK